MKAKIKTGKILIDKTGLAPMLFMEWMALNKRRNLMFEITDSAYFFNIKIVDGILENYQSCITYINDNLPEN